MSFIYFGMSEAEIRAQKRRDAERAERSRQKIRKINQDIAAMHRDIMRQRRIAREQQHRAFLNYIRGSRY